MSKQHIIIDWSTSDRGKVLEFVNAIKENVADNYYFEYKILRARNTLNFFCIDIETKKWDFINPRNFPKEEILFIDFSEVIDIPAFIRFLENLLNQEVLNLL